MAAVQQDGAEFKDVGFYADTCDENGQNCLVTELNDGNRACPSCATLACCLCFDDR